MGPHGAIPTEKHILVMNRSSVPAAGGANTAISSLHQEASQSFLSIWVSRHKSPTFCLDQLWGRGQALPPSMKEMREKPNLGN